VDSFNICFVFVALQGTSFLKQCLKNIGSSGKLEKILQIIYAKSELNRFCDAFSSKLFRKLVTNYENTDAFFYAHFCSLLMSSPIILVQLNDLF